MSTRTIKGFEKVLEKQAEQDRPSFFLGCHCTKCGTTWIICEMPQPMGELSTLTSKHKSCPCCKHDAIHIATPAQIRPLLAGKS